MKVDRARIIDEALKLLNEVGVDMLSTRLLAERLQVRQPALYWHFKNKRALLDAMNKEILERGHDSRLPHADEDWQHYLAQNTRSFRAALLAYRDAGRVHAGTEAEPDEMQDIEAKIAFLVAQGIDAGEAMMLFIALGRYTLGCVIEEQADFPEGPGRGAELDGAARDYPLTAAGLAHYREGGHAALFEAGLRFILDGAAAQLASAAVSKP
ncbi:MULTISPECIES: TetR/AcrR family transcriptional regulator C-terminal domain-containing protein [Phyllobacteriaceae]|jgi:TetR/AcrR family transcriptional regulator, tetracycline repressor protein|uniref:Transcriptional regulator n=1 Tax=Mesorhizobium hungaricum TaxID=1566387 RepID=A0A1C2DNA7_9HYPH|nr:MULTISPECIES: TetR/AcrR family transcriptional regulator C-terminal domain-containing protein [Mesorhizobium]MBN9233851.1 TetR/AcrR family transcriptional regulator C-terminal domain-containing protein [Mesorhizobium sp.]MDQ0328340.1 TetR/AcrR family tetracycline transcriptional repressor [Mesorhizobium sp. YL-MeA3-2017]OCX16258.1 transcriptional regulator [Mesorhizobium hungaricum]